MADMPGYALLGSVNTPEDLRTLPLDQLPALSVEMRRYLIETLGRIGGHFAANLGTVELTLALHYALNTPHDRLIWDVGHQAYAHKMLTGRRGALGTIRKRRGLAPFPHRLESSYDVFGTGHSSTSLSAAAGVAAATRVHGTRRRVAAVIGDGGMTAGMAFEAMNHIGDAQLPVLIVFNDNDMSISENVGALRSHSARTMRRLELAAAPHMRRPVEALEGEPDDHGAWVRTFGIDYVGPIDGHDLQTLLPTLLTYRDSERPVFLHVVTTKGKGFAPAEGDAIKYHGVTSFDPVTGAFPEKKAASAPSYTQIFGDWLCDAATTHPDLIAITPAMREGSGLVRYAKEFPDRYIDVAIAEQHAVTLAAGIATEGLRPVVAIYSTFLQRAYDQLIHDVAIQNLPVLFAIDRGGLVGADGATHHGAFDLSYLRCIPNMVVMAPSDENECRRMLATGLALNQPSAVRYPRGTGLGVPADNEARPLTVGRARVLREARGHRRPRVAMLAFGAMVGPALEAADILDATVIDMRFVKPLDHEAILEAAQAHDLLVTIEDNVRAGGAGSGVAEVLAAQHEQVPLMLLGLPDEFVEHGGREELLGDVGLDSAGIQRAINKRLRARDLDQERDNRSSKLGRA
ncbi:MAG: 1-deoxy-D-xylulose-5-phosphate synthase [Algiphilus sp.]|uniref:1-deoxy-D-xylulose-5-phosphate synthase n=1 Tax=Algiphilus sp. TaxID=1872431 RepID=UPI0032ED231C